MSYHKPGTVAIFIALLAYMVQVTTTASEGSDCVKTGGLKTYESQKDVICCDPIAHPYCSLAKEKDSKPECTCQKPKIFVDDQIKLNQTNFNQQ